MSDYETAAAARAAACAASGHARILAIESSCDDTAAAIVEDGRRVRAAAIASQIDEHALYGGVVPEIASRMHVEAVTPLCRRVLAEAGYTAADLDAVAVTFGPGLVGSLLVGVSFAKAYAWANKLPLVPVNHIEGHVSANYIAHPDLTPPFVCLVASGGHSHIVRVSEYGSYTLLGQTVDDAAGEAFDKVARVLDIPYPGGPLLDELAETGDPTRYRFPRPRTQGQYDFSFSGLKTAVINTVHTLRQTNQAIDKADFCASFRAAVVGFLVDRAIAATLDSGLRTIAIAGGVASNRLLRRELTARGEAAGLRVLMPPPRLCTDNAEMIGSAGYYRLMRGIIAPLSLNAEPAHALVEAETP